MAVKVKLRLRGGMVEELDIEELIEYDGKPFVSADSFDSKIDSIIDTLNHTIGRVDVMQELLSNQSQTPQKDNV